MGFFSEDFFSDLGEDLSHTVNGRILEELEEEQLEALVVREDTEKQEDAITCSQKYSHNSFMRFPPPRCQFSECSF